MQPTPVLLNQLEQVLSPQNNRVRAGSLFGHGLTLLVSTDATCLATQSPQSTFTAARILPTCPRHLLELSAFPGGTPSPAHPTNSSIHAAYARALQSDGEQKGASAHLCFAPGWLWEAAWCAPRLPTASIPQDQLLPV